MASKSTKVLQNVPLSKRRCGFTHVAMICDDTSLQPRLPQILIGNEAIFPVAKLESVRPSLPPNIRLWRRKTGWVTAEVMRDIVRELSAALGELTATRTVVLLLDTAPVHLCERFINMAARHKIAVQIIPAKMTWLLQPLDTHAFARFKMHLMHQYRAQLLRSARGECELTAVLESVILAIRHVLQGVAWAYAFDGNGFGTNGQAHLRTRTLKEMEWERLPELPARLPEYADLTSVFQGGGISHSRPCSGPTGSRKPSLQPRKSRQSFQPPMWQPTHCPIPGLVGCAAPATWWRHLQSRGLLRGPHLPGLHQPRRHRHQQWRHCCQCLAPAFHHFSDFL